MLTNTRPHPLRPGHIKLLDFIFSHGLAVDHALPDGHGVVACGHLDVGEGGGVREG